MISFTQNFDYVKVDYMSFRDDTFNEEYMDVIPTSHITSPNPPKISPSLERGSLTLI